MLRHKNKCWRQMCRQMHNKCWQQMLRHNKTLRQKKMGGGRIRVICGRFCGRGRRQMLRQNMKYLRQMLRQKKMGVGRCCCIMRHCSRKRRVAADVAADRATCWQMLWQHNRDLDAGTCEGIPRGWLGSMWASQLGRECVSRLHLSSPGPAATRQSWHSTQRARAGAQRFQVGCSFSAT